MIKPYGHLDDNICALIRVKPVRDFVMHFVIKETLKFLAIISLLAVCTFAQDPVKPAELNVLFIGNSLTYVNDLPEMVKVIAKHNGKKFKYKMVAYPDLSLEDHWAKGDAVKAIKDGKWDFVVLQQGSSALPASRTNLIEQVGRFTPEIRAVGAKPALFMVWPFESRKFDFDRVHESYELAAKAADGIFLPAGESWRAAWKQKPDLQLYSDGLHATALGSYLAAGVIYKVLYNESTFELPAKLKAGPVKIDLSPQEKDLARQAMIDAR